MVEEEVAGIDVDHIDFGLARIQVGSSLVCVVLAAPVNGLDHLLRVEGGGEDIYPEDDEDSRGNCHFFEKLPVMQIIWAEGVGGVCGGHACDEWVGERMDSLCCRKF